jgi:hypothetical protein
MYLSNNSYVESFFDTKIVFVAKVKQGLRNWHCGKVRSWALALQKYGRLAQLQTKTM